MVVRYGPNERDVEEIERFWNYMDRTLDSVGNGYMGDLNGWIEDRTTGAFGVPGENKGRRVVEFCAERGLCAGNTYFKHRGLHKYSRVERGQEGVEMKSMIDLVLVKSGMLRYVEDVRGMGRGFSDHHAVLCSQVGRSMD